MTLTRPLPGIRLEAVAQPLRDALPRMDIPGFAGFAASGPLHVPVAVEDVAQFAMIFGGDVELPSGNAHLGPSVRAFFRNGGKRCWVVRVANKAIANEFAVPNLLRLDPLKPALAIARSEGSWSDGIHVRTNLVSRVLPFVSSTASSVDVQLASPRDITSGDLVRVTYRDANRAMHLFVDANDRGHLTGTTFWLNTATNVVINAPANVPNETPSVELLTFDLTATRENDRPLRMTNLGFAPKHARYFGALPTDAQLYETSDWPDFWRDTAAPRFSLAAKEASGFYLPIGMASFFSEAASANALTEPPLVRDGLESFNAALFLDPNVGSSNVRDLLDRANALRYEAKQKLTGIHALLGIEELTMIAAPDAVHRGWFRDSDDKLATPPTEKPPKTDAQTKTFKNCEVVSTLEAPVLKKSAPVHGTFQLTWDTTKDATHEIEEATRPDFSDAATIFLGAGNSLTIHGRVAGDYFYRARTFLHGEPSAWSKGIGVRVAGIAGFSELASKDFSDAPLLAIHNALITMAAARGDLVTLLSLPRHYDATRAIAHNASLATRFDPNALSYAALWHPWLTGRDEEAGPLRTIPHEGATAGVMAQRANARGAWVAPANEALRGVIALEPAIATDARQSLQDAAVNLIRHEPTGFVCLDADTLSTDPDVRALNVRRLLILVRRAALRAGNDYAFEPNGPSLHNTIRRGFEALLSTLFLRGAFAGRTARAAYQVVTDESVNTRQTQDLGRVIAELRIAPSRPLSFLTIRLVQRGDAALVQEVR